MKKVFGITLGIFFLAIGAGNPSNITAQAIPSQDCCVVVEIEYAKTRLGNACILRGDWICKQRSVPVLGGCGSSELEMGGGL